MTALSSLITPVSGTSAVYRDEFTATAGQTVFTTTYNFTPNQIDVYYNGIKLINGTDVTVTSGTGFTLVSGALVGDKISAVYYFANIQYVTPVDNLVINGGMEVSQLNGSSANTVASNYQVDQWLVTKTGTMVCTAQQVADAPPGYTNSVKVTVGTAEASIGASDYTFITQPIEGFRTSCLAMGTSNAQYITIGFWTKIHRTGTYSGSIRNGALNRSYLFTFTQNVADTWEYKTVTFQTDITGTWVGNVNTAGMWIAFAMAAGSTFTGTANVWQAGNLIGSIGTTNGVAATSDVFQITGVSIIPGQGTLTSTSSSLLKRSFADELRLCERYFWKNVGAYPSILGNAFTSTAIVAFPISHPVPMRTAPTVTIFGTWTVTACGQPSVGSVTTDGFVLSVSATGASNVQALCDGATTYFTADARMT